MAEVIRTYSAETMQLQQGCSAAQVPAARPNLHSSNHTCSASYAAMCFCLLHEQDVMGCVIEVSPELWDCCSLGELQQALWGFLDNQP